MHLKHDLTGKNLPDQMYACLHKGSPRLSRSLWGLTEACYERVPCPTDTVLSQEQESRHVHLMLKKRVNEHGSPALVCRTVFDHVAVDTATRGLHTCGSRCNSSGARLLKPNLGCINAAVSKEATPLTQSWEQPPLGIETPLGHG